MKKNRIFKNLTKAFALGGLLLSLGGGIALASSTLSTNDTTTSTNSTTKKGFKGFMKGKENIKTKLANLVKDGKLTQEKVDKIIAYLDQKEAAHQAEREKIKNMTEEERKTYFETYTKEKVDISTDLVDQNILTQAEADILKAELPMGGPGRRGKGKGHKGMGNFEAKIETLQTTLSTLVKDGKLTQSKADQVISFLEKRSEERKAEREKIKNMTEEERKAYFETNKKQRVNPYTEMVQQNILTQEEADSIEAALPHHKK